MKSILIIVTIILTIIISLMQFQIMTIKKMANANKHEISQNNQLISTAQAADMQILKLIGLMQEVCDKTLDMVIEQRR